MNGKLRKLPTQQRLRELFDYNPHTGIFTALTDRRRWKAGRECGTVSGGYVSINVDYVIYRAHRLAWMWMTGEDPGPTIDNANGNPLDNRWRNLRKCDTNQNLSNKRIQSNNKLGIKGVYQDQNGRYRCGVQFKGKGIKLGPFSSPQEAKAAYDGAAKALQGRFARA